jgi:ATP-binding cassette, subfamily F, member 3
MLTITDLTYRLAGRTLFEGATVIIPARAKVGFVGKNGSGKTTLFKLIQGGLSPESGSISLPKGLKMGGVAQEAPGSAITLLDFVLAADVERTALLAEAETAQDPHRIADIHARLADIGAHSAEARAATILSGLGFDAAAQARPCSAFSGGWRMRVALAAVLFSEPDLLLLDEPTNYLDLEGTLWLESYVARYPHTVIMISHDRDLLNTCVDSIVHLDRGKLTIYTGGYDSFERQRREKMLLDQKMKVKIDAQRAHMQAFVDRFRYKASKARQAQSRLKALQKLEPIAALDEEAGLPITLPDPAGALSPPIVAVDRAAVGYEPGKPILKNVTLRIDADDRIALLGPNGNGKSTFAKLIASKLALMQGELTKATKLSIGYFAQHQLDELMPKESAVEHVRRLMPDAPEARVRSRVAQMGLSTAKMDTPAEQLSGGERARLLLGLSTFHGPNLIILDEPTNHLDIDSREALIQAINTYRGAVILISHDRHLIEATVDRLLIVGGGTVSAYDGDIDDYRKLVLETASQAARAERGDDERSGNQQERRRQAAERRKELAPLRKKIKEAEAKVAKWTAEIEKLDQRLADPLLFQKKPAEGAQLSKARADATKALAEAEDEWLTLSADYEAAETEGA